jgi:hypothetical protein
MRETAKVRGRDERDREVGGRDERDREIGGRDERDREVRGVAMRETAKWGVAMMLMIKSTAGDQAGDQVEEVSEDWEAAEVTGVSEREAAKFRGRGERVDRRVILKVRSGLEVDGLGVRGREERSREVEHEWSLRGCAGQLT